MFDIFIIGGGINGTGIARDAAGRGYSVCLAEKDDLAQGTSSGSTKLIHGGLRYLEHYEFRLVRESLAEREKLWSIAPHIIWPLRFILPHAPHLRPAWLLRIGLFLYDHIGGRRRLPPSRTLDLRSDPAGQDLKSEFGKAFEYSDCWVDDARLVALNARDAANHGALIRTRTTVTRAEKSKDHWRIELRDTTTGQRSIVAARLIINAAGPWVDEVLGLVVGDNKTHNIRLVQGSHIVVPKLFSHDRSYIFQNADGRIIFVIPYEQSFSLIGTTDRDYDGAMDRVEISTEEIEYLCRSVSEYFKQPVLPRHVVWTYSAVRPLFDDGASQAQEATRDYVIQTTQSDAGPSLMSIFGGKITTYRRLAEDVLSRTDKILDRRTAAWTAKKPLPGGDFPIDGYDAQVAILIATHPYLPRQQAQRLVRSYGTLAADILKGTEKMTDLGHDFGGGLSEREVNYLRTHEWAQTADDILWRRSKLGLHLDENQQSALTKWLLMKPATDVTAP